MSVTFQATPNPNAGKFTVGRTVVPDNKSRSFYNASQAEAEPIAAAIFELDGVASVFMVEDFVTVTKQPDADWSELIPRVTDTLERVLS
ncbi:MAG TPA: NifU N-terminal domain-containing protein [Longimicrobiales bacterium]|nr:NifU N-terminal domain-containing protein [Longimicrobiales bacterium]